MRLIVVGAGPIGIEAALAACARGFDVSVLEAQRVGASLLAWGPTRFFSPFGMNASQRLKAILGADCPGDEALLTGPEMVRQVIEPVSQRAPLSGRIFEQHRVVAISRKGMTRRDRPGHPLRAERPFQVLVDTPTGEQLFEAECVLDASGVGRPAPLGEGGLPALGERTHADEIVRDLGPLDARRMELAGKRVLVVGHGHSAANAIVSLAQLAREAAGTKIEWVVRTLRKLPCVDVASDPLQERANIVGRANALAADPPDFLHVERRTQVSKIEKTHVGLLVTLANEKTIEVDVIAAFTGRRPDLEIVSELPLAISSVSEGAAGIEAALSNVTDCLSAPKLTPDDLASGEPGFHLIGAKSYGRLTTFLIKNGIEQVESILDRLGE